MTAPPLSDAEALARLRLARTEGIGPLTYQRLLERHGSAGAALAALPRLAARRGAPFAVPRQLRWHRRAVVWRNTPPAGVWELQAVR